MTPLNIIVKMQFGSHLYGTATPQSDLDYKGIFLPSKEEVLLGRVPKSYSISTKQGSGHRNTSEDVDTEIYSLHYFLKLACEGQTVALDMVHAHDGVIIERSALWDELVANRHRFYTRSLQAFIGYARRQAAKYGIKGSRLNAAKTVLDALAPYQGKPIRLVDIWEQLPTGEHLHKIGKDLNGKEQYQICGKIVQETVTPDYAYGMVERFYKEYGKRAAQAAKNEGIDWKAVSHALRAVYQVRQLLTSKTIVFPLKEAPILTAVKKGEWDYSSRVVPLLDSLMDEVEALSETSDLPLKADRKFWDQWLIQTLEKNLFG